jgi:dinuclear metal center YbgI/SA1388 family protein
MPTVAEVSAFLDRFAPPRLAAEWDNVGLLIGDRQKAVSRLMTCLTVTPESVAEAMDERADLIVTHHPFPFKPTRRITSDTVEGRMVLDLVAARVAVYSPHTAFDSAAKGINQRLGEGLYLKDLAPLVADGENSALGTGRLGTTNASLSDLARRIASFLKIDNMHIVGEHRQLIRRVAIACGSAGDLLDAARAAGCECFVTGEARFHTCLEAKATGMAMILTGHYASERFAVEALAEVLQTEFADVKCWASRRECDPLRQI